MKKLSLNIFRFAIYLLFCVLSASLFADGECKWQENGICICEGTFSGGWGPLDIVSDSCGGAIVVWADNRGDYERICAQRVDSTGNILWDTGGVIIATDGIALEALEPHAVSDGNSGAIVTWSFVGGIYAQRVDSMGQGLWGDNGVVVRYPMGGDSTADYPSIVSDGKDGAIIGWVEMYYPGPDYWSLYLQSISSIGTPRWGGNGIKVTSETFAHFPLMKLNDKGGVIIDWGDYRNGNLDIYAQYFDSSGSEMWDSGGIGICIMDGTQGGGRIVKDDVENYIITWLDGRDVDRNIYTQRVDSDGHTLWLNNGLPICLAYGMQVIFSCVSDNVRGEIVIWVDYRYNRQDIYTQRVDSSGNTQWSSEGVFVSTAIDTTQQIYTWVSAVSDNRSGGIITWKDYRNNNWDIYAQRADSNGVLQWGIEGLPICTTQEDQRWGPVITTDGSGGAIIAWGDMRNSGSVYVQRVGDIDESIEEGRSGECIRVYSAPNPSSNPVIRYSIDKTSYVSLIVYDVTGRLIETLVDETQEGGDYTVRFDARNLPSGVYFLSFHRGKTHITDKTILIK